jgi:hypothetical protein
MTYQIGSFGEALLRAIGIAAVGAETKLHRITDAALKEHAPSLTNATDAVEKAIRAEDGMLLALLDKAQFTRPLVERFVARRATHIRVRLDKPKGGGQNGDGIHKDRAPSINSPDAAQAAGGGRTSSDTHCDGAPAPSSARPGSSDGANVDLAPADAAPRRAPGHAKRTAANVGPAVAVMRQALLDTIIVNGQRLRDVTAGEALAFAEKQVTTARQIDAICRGLNDMLPVGQQITDEQAEDRWRRAQNAGKPAGGGRGIGDAHGLSAPAPKHRNAP